MAVRDACADHDGGAHIGGAGTDSSQRPHQRAGASADRVPDAVRPPKRKVRWRLGVFWLAHLLRADRLVLLQNKILRAVSSHLPRGLALVPHADADASAHDLRRHWRAVRWIWPLGTHALLSGGRRLLLQDFDLCPVRAQLSQHWRLAVRDLRSFARTGSLRRRNRDAVRHLELRRRNVGTRL